MDKFDFLKALIGHRLKEFDFQASPKRIDHIFYTMMWDYHRNMDLTAEGIDNDIKDLYNFRMFKNTRLALKKTKKEDIIKKTDKWIYVRDYGDKK